MLPFGFADTPRWFPHQLNPENGRVLLVERSEEDFRAASFLDDRSLAQGGARQIVTWAETAGAMPTDARRDVQYIFHIGHVGSTLISRLLGELPSVLALREPLLLRTFAELPAEPARLDTLAAIFSRTFRPEQRALVKATSFVSEIADALVPAGSCALFLCTSPQRYLENILAGAASRQEVQMLAQTRANRLNGRLGETRWNPDAMSEGQKAALGWACEMTALHGAGRRLPTDTVMWEDFDRFLASPAPSLADIAAFFGHVIDAAATERLARGPLMSRYSKALEYEYSPQLRAEVLAESRAANRSAIAAGMAWLDEAAKHYPALADCLARRD